MKVKIPSSVRVGGYDFEIETGEVATRELENKSNFGDCTTYLKRIRISSNLSKQETDNVFIHELLHAVDYVFVSEETTEATINSLANGLHQVFRELGIEFEIG